jgi:hypothetical protein
LFFIERTFLFCFVLYNFILYASLAVLLSYNSSLTKLKILGWGLLKRRFKYYLQTINCCTHGVSIKFRLNIWGKYCSVGDILVSIGYISFGQHLITYTKVRLFGCVIIKSSTKHLSTSLSLRNGKLKSMLKNCFFLWLNFCMSWTSR